MREPQPSHVGRSGEHVRAHLSAPRLKRGRETPCPLPPKPKERPMKGRTSKDPSPRAQPGTDFREGNPFCGGFVCLLFWFCFCNILAPQRDTQVREAFTPAPWCEMGHHIFPSHNPLTGLVLPPSCFAKWLCRATSPVLSPAVLQN